MVFEVLRRIHRWRFTLLGRQPWPEREANPSCASPGNSSAGTGSILDGDSKDH
jgi:hypothetical protein